MTSIVIVGGSHQTAVGQSLLHAANSQSRKVRFVDADVAFKGPRLLQSMSWHLLQKRPLRLGKFNRILVATCKATRPSILISAGNLPITYSSLKQILSADIRTAIYSTDDPWNPCHLTKRFQNSLQLYDQVFSTRRANIRDFRELGCAKVSHLPFGYDDRYFYPTENIGTEVKKAEVFFAGGADNDRVPLMEALIKGGIDLALYGGLWEGWKQTNSAFRGYASPQDLAGLIASSLVCLCLVRRANRDGSSMRSFELAAAKACMVAEDTEEHRDLYGENDKAVRYFQTESELIQNVRSLIASPADRERLSEGAYRLITAGNHRYSDRLDVIIERLTGQ
jgi:spore maturation protein CgeB